MTTPGRSLDPTADQRGARTYAEVEAEKKRLNEASQVASGHAYFLTLGAWLALAWVLGPDDDPMPLEDRLRNVTG